MTEPDAPGRDGAAPAAPGRDGTAPAAPDEDVFGDVLPDTTADEREPDPGERAGEHEDDERILRERPPHW
jgi:hypothetical protein